MNQSAAEGTMRRGESRSIVVDLVTNSQEALMAAVEIYNKPTLQYRDECTVILLLNAWELLLKAILAKHERTIYYPEKTTQPPRTLSWSDAFPNAEEFFPQTVSGLATRRNLDLLGSYRDKAVHFYNQEDISLVMHSLSQTAIVNFRDVLLGVFDTDIADQMNWRLLPIGIRPPIDVISFLQEAPQGDVASAMGTYLTELWEAAAELKATNEDSGRLLTVFNIKLESVKKIGDADAVVAVDNDPMRDHMATVIRRQDPNTSHPLRQKDILAEITELHGQRFTQHTFQAIIWKYKIKEQPQYSWVASEGVLTRYSRDILTLIRQLTKTEVQSSLNDYRDHLRGRVASKPT